MSFTNKTELLIGFFVLCVIVLIAVNQGVSYSVVIGIVTLLSLGYGVFRMQNLKKSDKQEMKIVQSKLEETSETLNTNDQVSVFGGGRSVLGEYTGGDCSSCGV